MLISGKAKNNFHTKDDQEKDVNEEVKDFIEGIAEEEIQLINYMTILEQSFGIGNVQDEIVLDKEKNMYQYTLTIRMFDESETLEDIVEMQDGIEGGAE